jgi:hypothetical protein
MPWLVHLIVARYAGAAGAGEGGGGLAGPFGVFPQPIAHSTGQIARAREVVIPER